MLAPSEVKELRRICSDMDTPALESDEFDAIEADYEARNGYELAVAYRHDPESFAIGGPLFGLHPRHAVQVASRFSTPVGWNW